MDGVGNLAAGAGSAFGGYEQAQASQKNAKLNFALQNRMMDMAQQARLPGGQETAGQIMGAIPGLTQYNTYGQNLGQAQGIAQGMVSDPRAGGAQGAADLAGAAMMGQGQTNMGAGSTMMGAGMSMVPYAEQIMQTSMDPQNALRDRTQQQLLESTRASQAARGIAMGPYGAGLENQAMSNFNIDWQNNLLQREATGAGAAGGLLGNAGRSIVGGAELAATGPGMIAQGGMLPYQTSQGIGQNQLGALNSLGQFGQSASQLPQTQIGDMAQYLGLVNQAAGMGISGTGQAANFGLNAQNQGFNQNAQAMSNMGAGMGGLWSGLSSLYNQGNTGWGNSVAPTSGTTSWT